jgi:cell division protein FtsZ
MMALQMRGVEFIAANTDLQALESNPAPTHILLGPNSAKGLGAGGTPERGREAAEESRAQIAAALAGADMVFLTAGMGGGTGTGAIPVAAEIARAQGAVAIAIVTTPFSFEMGRRQKNAAEGLQRLREHTHTLISIPNDRLLYVAPRNLPMEMAFRLADDVLRQAVQGLTELITEPGLINVDFAHIRRLILLGGGALMSIGQGKGENKAMQALDQALHHPLLEDVSLRNAAGVIVNFTGGSDLTLFEVQDALTELQAQTGPNTDVIFGVINDERMEGRAQMILMITGLGGQPLEEALPGFRSKAASAPSASIGRSNAPAMAAGSAPSDQTSHAPAHATPLTLNTSPAGRDLPPFFRYRYQDRRNA